LAAKFKEEEKFIVETLESVRKHIDSDWTHYSKVSEALFIKTMRQTIAKNCGNYTFE
jgi:hypothetical protein